MCQSMINNWFISIYVRFYFHERDDNKSVNENIIKIVHNSKQILKCLQCIVSNINYINMVGMNTLQNWYFFMNLQRENNIFITFDHRVRSRFDPLPRKQKIQGVWFQNHSSWYKLLCTLLSTISSVKFARNLQFRFKILNKI